MENLISYGISSFLKASIIYDPSTKGVNQILIIENAAKGSRRQDIKELRLESVKLRERMLELTM